MKVGGQPLSKGLPCKCVLFDNTHKDKLDCAGGPVDCKQPIFPRGGSGAGGGSTRQRRLG